MKSPAVSLLLGIFLLGSVGLLFVAKNENNELDNELKITKSNADSLSKVIESLDKDVYKFRGRSDSLSIKNADLEKSLTLTNSKLAARNGEVLRNKKTTDEINRKYNDLVASQTDLNKQLATLKTLNDQLGQEKENLISKTALFSDDNKQLNDRLLFVVASAKDNILIETMNKGGKLNLKGKRVRKIVTTLSLQSEMKNPTFRIFDPNGIQLPEQFGSFNLKSTNETSANSPSGNSMKIELTYLLSKKIGPGLYKIEILNENKHVGNLLVRFR